MTVRFKTRSHSKLWGVLGGGLLYLVSGCGWATLWYEADPLSFELRYASVTPSIYWGEYDHESGKCEATVNWQQRGSPTDTLLLVRVVCLPADLSLEPDERYKIDDFRVLMAAEGTPEMLGKCHDTILYPQDSYGYQGPYHIFYFGPLVSPQPLPDSLSFEFAVITEDRATGRELSYERVKVVARKKTKSILKDFLDGR